jgi:hypothetical protein
VQKYQNSIQDVKGNAIAGASINVYLYGTLTTATIYSDNGVTLITPGSLTTDPEGEFGFYAANGRYTIVVIATGFTSQEFYDVLLFDPADANIITPALTSSGDQSAAIQQAIDYVKANGGTVTLPAGTFRCKNLRLESGTKTWAMTGAGKYATVLEHLDGNGTLLIGNDGSSVGYTLSGFTVDCKYSVYAHPSANNGISYADTSNVTISDVHVRDFKNCSILAFANTANTYGDCLMVDCSFDGLNNAINGMLFVDMNRCGFVRCKAVGTSKSGAIADPGYGIQFKNDCRYGYIDDVYAERCVVGVAFGLTGATGVTNTNVNNVRVTDCISGVLVGGAVSNTINNVYIDMTSSNAGTYPGENAIDIQSSSVGNTLSNIVVYNIRSVRSAVRVRTGCTDNHVHVGVLNNINTTGVLATLDTGAQYNYIRLSRQLNPRVRSAGLGTMVSFGTASDANAWEYDGYAMSESKTIASGVITIGNQKSSAFVVDTEGSAATDDLDTITFAAAVDGTVISLRSANDARDVVVKYNTGNIVLTGGTDVTLGTRRSVLVLQYSAVTAKWLEVSVASNP